MLTHLIQKSPFSNLQGVETSSQSVVHSKALATDIAVGVAGLQRLNDLSIFLCFEFWTLDMFSLSDRIDPKYCARDIPCVA